MESNESTFIRVVEAGSLKAAAEQIGTDPSSVSRKIAALEARLGVKLLQRSTRRSTPTEAGEHYYKGMRKLLDEKAALESYVAHESDTPRGLLRVSAPNNFGEEHVAPVLTSMMAMYPELRIEIILSSSRVDMTGQGIDVAIRFGELPDSSLICRKLSDIPTVLVASPHYLKNRSTPKVPADLASHDFILFTRLQLEDPIRFKGKNGTESVKISERYIINNAQVIRQLVLDGFGISIGAAWPFREYIETGELVQLLPEYEMPPYPIHATYPATAFVPAKIRRFVDLMAEYCQEYTRKLTVRADW